MATVPTVTGPSVQLNAAPNAYQTAPAGLGGAGMVRAQQFAQAAQVAGTGVELLQKQQNRDDIDAVFRAETALKDEYLKVERDELGKYGANAKGAGERTQQWWGEAERRYAEGLNERQRSAFDRSFQRLRQASTGTMLRHEQHQGDKALEASATARIGTAIGAALADPTPERIANSRIEILESVGIAGKLTGLPPEALAQKQTEALTLMHKGVVERMADLNPDQAKAYYYTHKKEIASGTQAVIEKTLERGGLLAEAQGAADEIMGRFGDMASAMSHIEKTYSGDKEKEIKAQVAERFTRVQQSKNQISQSAYETAMLHTVQGQKVPAAVWAQMDDGHKAAIIEKREAEAKARRIEAEGRQVKTDFMTWDKINRLVSDDPKTFAQLDVGRFADRLSRADMEEFGKLQRKVREGGEGAKQVATTAQQISTTVDLLKLGGANNAEKRGQLERAIYESLNVEQRNKGKELSYDERQKVIDRQIIDVSIPGFIWDTKKKAFEVQGTPDAEKAKIAVPDNDRKMITEALKAKGRTVDEAAILDLYRRQKGLQ